MATIRLVPSTYAVSSTSYLSVSNASNMYTNTDSTTYATITNTNASTSSRYLYLRGFNFGSIPSDAIINSFTIKVKGYESGLATSTSYAPRLANGTSVLSNTTASSNFGTSTKTITIPTGALTWEQIVNYGSNFTIYIYVRRSSRNTTGYAYIHGAEILVDYTIPIYHSIIASVDQDATLSSTSASVLEGEPYVLSIYPNDNSTAPVSVTDNNIDVTSQVVSKNGQASSVDVTTASGASYGFTQSGSSWVSSNTGHNGSAAVSVITLTIRNTATVTINAVASSESGYDYGYLSEIGNTFSTSASTESSYKWRGSGSDSSTVSYGTLQPGTYTIYAKYYKDNYSESGSDTFTFTVNISETVPTGIHYEYTINNVTADHIIVVTYGQQETLYFKPLGNWIKATKIYKKVSGSWTEVQLDTLTDRKLYFYKGGVGYNNSNIVMNFDGIDSYASRYQDDTSGFEGDWVYPNGISNNFMRAFDIVADGQSFTFNGTTSYVRPNASAAFDNFLYTTHTIEAYFELSSFDLTDGNAFMLYVGRNSKQTVAIYCYYYQDNIYFIKSSGVNSKQLIMPSISLNKKHYIAANSSGWMFDGIYYPDSESSAGTSSAATNDMLNVSGQYACASIGMRFKDGRNPDPFNGKLYAMRIHNSILTKNQLLQNMMCDIGRFGS